MQQIKLNDHIMPLVIELMQNNISQHILGIGCFDIIQKTSRQIENMIDKQFEDLERNRKKYYERLSELNDKYRAVYKEYEQLGEYASQDLQDQISRIESNIDFMKGEIVEANKNCSQKVALKKKYLESIRQFEEKRHRLSDILLSEGGKLKEIKKGNLYLQGSIKRQREEYQELQQEIYDLDDRIENLKMFGVEVIPQQMLLLIKKKQVLISQIEQKSRQIDSENALINRMVKKEQIDQIKGQIRNLQNKRQRISFLENENEELRKVNENLNKIKSQYEWNPNLQIKSLENNMQEQQNKISVIEKQIGLLNKKSSECSLKIQEYKTYLRRAQRLEGFDDLADDQSSLSGIKKQRSRRDNRHNIFESIKKQLQNEDVTKQESMFSRIKSKLSGYKQNKQKAQQKVQKSESKNGGGDGTTYILNKKINLIQFWIVVIVLCALSYYCHLTYRK